MKDLIEKISENADALGEVVSKLETEIAKIDSLSKTLSAEEKARKYQKIIVPLMKQARVYADFLEENVDAKLWQYPRYNKLLDM
ncbi:MAG: hypothetical protein BWY78_01160 [Alphaproteobacteria bacterium ADurb.Bin438]|nr:MAG: hypothetical protein BWY78_01160 [Alphaproteobacteria bacterium ADurb.Bin438]